MSIYVEGTNNPIVREIMSDIRLSRIFMDWVEAPQEDKEKFRFVRYKETGSLDIIDTREKEVKKKEHTKHQLLGR